MKRTVKTSAVALARPGRRDDAPGPRCDQAAQRFRATARQIATQLDIEAAMWRILDQEAER